VACHGRGASNPFDGRPEPWLAGAEFLRYMALPQAGIEGKFMVAAEVLWARIGQTAAWRVGLGYEDVRLYNGSMAEWRARHGKIETGP
jgi:hypothetical protein